MPHKTSFLYAFLKPWVNLGARLFFRRIEVDFIEKLPTDKPVILVANHQNAMLDPVVACLYSRKQLHWLTRADIFRKPSLNKLLRSLNMLPVYRERDRVSDLAERNAETFNECYDRLSHHSVICIFPEGTHRGKKQLVPLKKGAARLVTGALDAGIHDIQIVPIGLDYENYYQYRKNLLVRFGDPIDIEREQLLSGNDRARLQTNLTDKIRQALSSVMIDIKNDDVYEEITSLRYLINQASGETTLGGQFDFYKKFTLVVEDKEDHLHFLRHEVRNWFSLSHRLKISDDLFAERTSPLLALWLLLGLPFAAFSAMVFYPIYALTENFVKSKVKDPLFRNSIRLVFWTFLSPMLLLLLFGFLKLVGCTNFGSWITVFSAVLSGVISLYWWQGWKCWRHQQYCASLSKAKNQEFTEWLNGRSQILSWLKKVME